MNLVRQHNLKGKLATVQTFLQCQPRGLLHTSQINHNLTLAAAQRPVICAVTTHLTKYRHTTPNHMSPKTARHTAASRSPRNRPAPLQTFGRVLGKTDSFGPPAEARQTRLTVAGQQRTLSTLGSTDLVTPQENDNQVRSSGQDTRDHKVRLPSQDTNQATRSHHQVRSPGQVTRSDHQVRSPEITRSGHQVTSPRHITRDH